MNVYRCKSPFCNCEYSENEGGCGCKNKEHDCCKCCCCCCHEHHHHDEHDCNERVCYAVAVESFNCCSCWSRC